MTDAATTDTLALIRDLAAGLGLPVATGPEAEARFARAVAQLERVSPGAVARMRDGLGDRLQREGAAVRAAGAVQ